MAQTVAVLDSPLSLRLGCVLGFCRVCAESLARVVCFTSVDSSRILRCHPNPGHLSRSSRAWQPAITSFLESELDPAGATTLSLGRKNQNMMRLQLLNSIAIGALILPLCGCREAVLDYQRYATVFSTDEPPASSFVHGTEEDGGDTMLFEFNVNETEYNGIAERLLARGFTVREPLDGQFGSWSAFNTPGKPVFGQSKHVSFGSTYYYFEPARNRLTAIARFTTGR